MPIKQEEETFRSDLIALIPHMRAFARSLCGDPNEAEDLAQEALAKAWAGRAGFTAGTNLKAWTFMILRNQFYSDRRRSWRSCQLDPEVAERSLVANTSPIAAVELDELRRAIAMLPDEQREALILIGAAGLSYEEASEVCGVAVGTIKSRVSRARDRLALIYADGAIAMDGVEPSKAFALLLAQAERLSLAHCA
ncbi:MAG TPA: sigma-70 family RNA polymerase sigma factor [Caulobacteraceae bacterium]|jgi:RNA polymerase sigma-70 factor (ECF subfamily)|nr:sigma-70 family RNA polymerase sigma factor [Caulobacteraceae bacterium]